MNRTKFIQEYLGRGYSLIPLKNNGKEANSSIQIKIALLPSEIRLLKRRGAGTGNPALFF
ncbi:unnamed protein product [marine sediment metagenome]|uniref:Uncharacterized protein n=1 Tax=marine sediment metagenome TaxID=412755 RepID=X1Q5J6_9ZZZZ